MSIPENSYNLIGITLGAIVVLVLIGLAIVLIRTARNGPNPSGFLARRKVEKRYKAVTAEAAAINANGGSENSEAAVDKSVKRVKSVKPVKVTESKGPARKRGGYNPPLVAPAQLKEVMANVDEKLGLKDLVEEPAPTTAPVAAFPARPKVEPVTHVADEAEVEFAEPETTPEATATAPVWDSKSFAAPHDDVVTEDKEIASEEAPAVEAPERPTKVRVPENPFAQILGN